MRRELGYKGEVTHRADTLTAAFYGDDFTGSTDALTQFHRFGLRAVLLFDCPDKDQLTRLAADYDVVGVAGVGRSLPTEKMEDEIRPVLAALGAAGPRLVQYKMCSTADSSPRIGSLGRAVEIGRRTFGAAPVPILAAQPEFGRYTAFGNHFAVDGDMVHRLDRQPTMSRHPATPMTEADLRVHIGQQTSLRIASLDLPAYDGSWSNARLRYRDVLADEPGAVVFDAVTADHTIRAAELMFAEAGEAPLYAMGSGGLSYGAAAVLAHGLAHGLAQGLAHGLAQGPAEVRASPQARIRSLEPVDRLLVVSGSCSPRTAEQIRYVLDRGWVGIPLQVDAERGVETGEVARRQLRQKALAALSAGKSVVVYSSLGVASSDRVGDPLASIGEALGDLVRAALENVAVRRVVVAGGDTSGRVVRALGAVTAEVDTMIGVGTVVCRLDGEAPGVRGARVLLKGGQAGPVDLFERVRVGQEAPRDGERMTTTTTSHGSAEALGIS